MGPISGISILMATWLVGSAIASHHQMHTSPHHGMHMHNSSSISVVPERASMIIDVPVVLDESQVNGFSGMASALPASVQGVVATAASGEWDGHWPDQAATPVTSQNKDADTKHTTLVSGSDGVDTVVVLITSTVVEQRNFQTGASTPDAVSNDRDCFICHHGETIHTDKLTTGAACHCEVLIPKAVSVTGPDRPAAVLERFFIVLSEMGRINGVIDNLWTEIRSEAREIVDKQDKQQASDGKKLGHRAVEVENGDIKRIVKHINRHLSEDDLGPRAHSRSKRELMPDIISVNEIELDAGHPGGKVLSSLRDAFQSMEGLFWMGLYLHVHDLFPMPDRQ